MVFALETFHFIDSVERRRWSENEKKVFQEVYSDTAHNITAKQILEIEKRLNGSRSGPQIRTRANNIKLKKQKF